MNSRQRVLTALNHQEPDRVPFDMGGTVVTGIHYRAYEALRAYLGLPQREPKIIDMIQLRAQVDEDVMERGGFIFNTVHNTQGNVPPENLMAMWETVQEFGRYRQPRPSSAR
jgi:uroporphyrinogen-III decarboxylase